ncbi:4'-phosphopantetheinyl transferase family protein [Arthrobacter sp. NQ4]|uniref:4'-phosphopantetheinyl transferase family protein n=1 Tax=Arthrobacter sp. NQ4 TaxID=3027930 RepID=UPI0023B113DB|nr:4'-phosphopantetheinyl transferase family protein [Arthrobacter sp. NQ4]MDE8586676.1 4'-phosphopantetheinyl transferase superfamily protein [Arthrobacter sp. NQ4]
MAQCEVRAIPPFLLSGKDSGMQEEAEGLLDSVELARAKALPPAAGIAFLAGRLAQRRLAPELLSLPAADLTVAYSCPQCGTGPGVGHGRPGYSYRGAPVPLALSLSRAAGWTLLVAVVDASPGTRLGADIEDPSRTGFDGFDRLALTPAERRNLRNVRVELLPAARARLWARKEAWLKMTGDGLRTAPSTVDVSGRPGLRDLGPAETGLPAHLAAAVALSGPVQASGSGGSGSS